MKKIVIDARELSTSTGRYIERLLHYLQEVDTDLSHRYIVLLKPRDMNKWEPSSKRFSKLLCPFKEFSFAEQTGLLLQVLRLRADLVHFGMVQQPILYRGKVVTTMHDLTTLRFPNPSKNRLIFDFKRRVYYWVNFIVARKSKAIISPTEFVKEDIAKTMRANSRKIVVTPEAADLIKDKPETMEDLENKRFIMYVGRPTPHKNLKRLIEAFSKLKERHPELNLVLVGKQDTLYRQHAKEVERLGIPDVHFTGFVSEGQLRWLYEHAAAYVFPSLSEGFGLPPLEAMAHGAPVAASSSTCIPEVCGKAAEYFDPTDVEAIEKAVDKILTNHDLRNKLIATGRKQVQKYSWERMARQTVEVYKQVLGEG